MRVCLVSFSSSAFVDCFVSLGFLRRIDVCLSNRAHRAGETLRRRVPARRRVVSRVGPECCAADTAACVVEQARHRRRRGDSRQRQCRSSLVRAATNRERRRCELHTFSYAAGTWVAPLALPLLLASDARSDTRAHTLPNALFLRSLGDARDARTERNRALPAKSRVHSRLANEHAGQRRSVSHRKQRAAASADQRRDIACVSLCVCRRSCDEKRRPIQCARLRARCSSCSSRAARRSRTTKTC